MNHSLIYLLIYESVQLHESQHLKLDFIQGQIAVLLAQKQKYFCSKSLAVGPS